MSNQTKDQKAKNNKVLIADDDPTIRMMVQSILEAEGYNVVAAEDGRQASEFLEQRDFASDLAFIVLDVMMPGMTGLDVLTRIKLHSVTSAIPVIMLTGENKDSDIMAGYEQGADYYITKPFTRQQLIFGIQTALGG
jgi:CheY-like chemotaxis protein